MDVTPPPERPALFPWRRWLLGMSWLLALLVVGAVVLLAAPISLRWDSLQPREVAVRYRQAQERLQAGALREAILSLEALRDENPLNPLIHAALGQAYRQAGRTSDAIAATRMALERDPGLGEAAYNLACDQAKLGQQQEALQSLHHAVEAGLDLGAVVPGDPDLVGLREAPALRATLRGLRHLPLSRRSASLRVSPERLETGMTFSVWVELVDLEARLTDPGSPEDTAALVPPAPRRDAWSLAWRGAPTAPGLVLLAREVWIQTGLVSPDAGAAVRVELRFRAEEAGTFVLGPWEVQIGGIQVPLATRELQVFEGASILRVSGSPSTPAPPSSGRSQTGSPTWAGVWRLPSPLWHPVGSEVGQSPVLRLESPGLKYQGAWGLELELPPALAAHLDAVVLDTDLTPGASYAEMEWRNGERSRVRRGWVLEGEPPGGPGAKWVGVRVGVESWRLRVGDPDRRLPVSTPGEASAERR